MSGKPDPCRPDVRQAGGSGLPTTAAHQLGVIRTYDELTFSDVSGYWSTKESVRTPQIRHLRQMQTLNAPSPGRASGADDPKDKILA